MTEIKINIDELNSSIAQFQWLKTVCDSNYLSPPETVGGGQTVSELEALAQLYKDIEVNMSQLVSDTILFLQNVRDSFVESDEKVKQTMMD